MEEALAKTPRGHPSSANYFRRFYIDDAGHIHHLLRVDDATFQDRDLGALGNITLQHFEQKDRPADYHSKRRTNKPVLKNPFPSRRIIQRLIVIPTELEGENEAVKDPAVIRRPKVLSTDQ